jgi:hypothetical protein
VADTQLLPASCVLAHSPASEMAEFGRFVPLIGVLDLGEGGIDSPGGE